MLTDKSPPTSAVSCTGQAQLDTLHHELSSVSPYVQVLLSQLDAILKETEDGVLTAILKANALDASYKQGASAALPQTNPQALEILTDLLGGLQFQDVVRQRLEQVCKALVQLDAHFAALAVAVTDPAWQGECTPSLQDKMARFAEDYVMHSQVAAHLQVSDFKHKAHSHQSIELF